MSLQKQIAEFHAAVLQGLPELTSAEMQEWIGPSRSTLRSGLSFLSLGMISINRTTRPVYPDWLKPESINEPEFIRIEATGPAKYLLSSLELSLHPKQQEGGIATGHEVWEYQKKLGIEGCPGFADLLEIQKLGLATFRCHFQDKAVFGWKSVVQDDDGYLDVPCLVEYGSQVKLYWHWLGLDWFDHDPALRFAK